MGNSPLLSVIVPVYNVEKYLRKCLESIINQTYQNLEIILIDDGATDSSGAICDEYAAIDSRIKVIHKENEGQAVGRNCGLDIAKGEYIAFIDADDYIKKEMLAVMLREMQETDSDVAICGLVFRHGKNLEKPFSHVREKVYGDNDLLMKKYFSQKVFTGMCNKVYKASLFDDIRFPKVRAREDTYILHEVLGKCKKFVELPDCFYVQNIRSDSTEQRPFSQEKLDVSYQALTRRIAFARQYYPHYAPLNQMLLSNLFYQSLIEVVAKNGEKTKSESYKNLFERFQEEVMAVDCEAILPQDKRQYERFLKFIRNPKKLYASCLRKKAIFRLKKKAKKIVCAIGGEK